MSEEEKYSLIENYAQGNFSKEEKDSFEKLLSTDPELARQYRLYKLADELVIENRLLKVNTLLLKEHTDKGGNTGTKIILSFLLLAAGSLMFFVWKNKQSTGETIITKDKTIAPISVIQHKEQIQTTIANNRVVQNSAPDKILSPVALTANQEEMTEKNAPVLSSLQTKLNDTVSTVKNNTAPVATAKKIPDNSCVSIHIDAKISTLASCKDEPNGSISLSDIKGGTNPYSISIRNKQNEEVSSLNVPPGNYSALISDKKGCSRILSNIAVPEKICEKEYSFNPFMDEVLSLPAFSQYGTLTVYERSGALYFTKETEPSEQIQWNGYSKNGELNTGYFIFVIQYKNGNMIKGGITIVR